jgi:subtilisin family serine protease
MEVIMNHPGVRIVARLLGAGLAVTTALAAPASAAVPKPPAAVPEVVVKLDVSTGVTVADIEAAYGLTVLKDVLGSRHIYLMAPDAKAGAKPKTAKEWAAKLSKDARLEYAEPNFATDASDDRFHAWPSGDPEFVGTDPSTWLRQPVVAELALDAVHARANGAGVTVAVLDTGIDVTHPALAGRLRIGWDYVGDDRDPAEARDGLDSDGDGHVDEAFGHGTHVAGIVALVAPAARIMPVRVLDANGRGNVFAVAEALADVVADGADVVNLSFGTEDNVESKVMKDAISRAEKAGVVVIASAGNTASSSPRFPASNDKVIGVGGEDASMTRLAWFSNRGNWVRATAPSEGIVSAVPGGGYARWSGTSMAAPFVSGQAALIHQLRPRLSSKQVRDAVVMSEHQLTDGSPKERAIDILASIVRLK